MRRKWFTPWGWLYRPISLAGWIVTIGTAVFCVQVFFAIDRHSHSVSDTLYGVFPFAGCSFLLWNWVASKTSRGPGRFS